MSRKSPKFSTISYKGYLHLPHVLVNSERFAGLSPRGVKLLIDIAAQYRGNNNGDLQATKSCLEGRGWTSNAQLTAAKRELLDKGFIVKTRQGGLGMSCDLFAISWQPIDECNGKLDVCSTTNAPINWLKEEKERVANGTLYDFKNMGNRGVRK